MTDTCFHGNMYDVILKFIAWGPRWLLGVAKAPISVACLLKSGLRRGCCQQRYSLTTADFLTPSLFMVFRVLERLQEESHHQRKDSCAKARGLCRGRRGRNKRKRWQRGSRPRSAGHWTGGKGNKHTCWAKNPKKACDVGRQASGRAVPASGYSSGSATQVLSESHWQEELCRQPASGTR